jgi:hypothetical protein
VSSPSPSILIPFAGDSEGVLGATESRITDEAGGLGHGEETLWDRFFDEGPSLSLTDVTSAGVLVIGVALEAVPGESFVSSSPVVLPVNSGRRKFFSNPFVPSFAAFAPGFFPFYSYSIQPKHHVHLRQPTAFGISVAKMMLPVT